MEKHNFNLEQAEKSDEIKFFEDRGYENIEKSKRQNFNTILYANKDNQECFIKKYKSRQETNEKDFEKANTEISCYQNLPEDILIDVVEMDIDEHFLALKREELEDVEKDEQFVEDFVDMGLNRFAKIDAEFLPKTEWSHYETTFDYLKEIEEAGFINDADKVIKLFKDNKKLIENAEQIFSHQDFGPPNVKRIGEDIKVFDFEFSRRDNAMYDMACTYIDIKDNEALKEKFDEKINKSDLFNQDLLDLMVIRRAVVVMNARLSKMHKEENRYFRTCKEVFNEKVNDLLN